MNPDLVRPQNGRPGQNIPAEEPRVLNELDLIPLRVQVRVPLSAAAAEDAVDAGCDAPAAGPGPEIRPETQT